MRPIGTARGQPLVAMVFAIVAWIAVRMMMWEAGIEPPLPALDGPAGPSRAVASGTAGAVARPVVAKVPFRPVASQPVNDGKAATGVRTAGKPLPPPPFVVAVAPPGRLTTDVPAYREWTTPRAAPNPQTAPPPATARRWTGDSWLLAREGGGRGVVGGAAPATYGASQAGAVLRYRLIPGDPHRPAAFVRATTALDGSREKELALGFSGRPLAMLPVIAAAELRAAAQSGSTRLRPAAMLISEVPAIALPNGLRAEVYAQAGYVSGRYATAFADGQLRIDRRVAAIGRGELRLGAGGWGGAQKGVSRADIGPGATLAVPLGSAAAARVAIDWRLRIAGNAAPASGPTLTLSAGF